ncbi:MAG: acyl carrier protein [Alphaproteobacteria bacterium]|nr:MAG: acyl carrier protein [Alphaproteobacteria bacterium]
MERQQIEKKVLELLKDQKPDVQWDLTSSLDKVDSLDTIEINFAIESEFNVSISEEDAQKLKGVSCIVDYIDRKINGAKL